GLGVTEPFRLREHAGVWRILLLHLREDIITGAVEDAVDPRKAIRNETLAQYLDDRDAARHRGLEEKMSAMLLRRRKDFRAVFADQRLVGGNDDLAATERGER